MSACLPDDHPSRPPFLPSLPVSFFVQVPFAHEGPTCRTLIEAVRELKPTAIIGVSTIPQAFTEEVLRTMAEFNERPIVFPLVSLAGLAGARYGGTTLGGCPWLGLPLGPSFHP